VTIVGMHISDLYLARGLTVVVIVVLTALAVRIAGGLVRRWMARSGAVPTTSIFVNITRAAVILLGGVFVLEALGVSITPVLTALGVGGLAVALALQDTLGNLFAGLQIVASKQIRPGDYLLLDTGQEGTVVDTAWRTTTLRTQSDNLVIVPNSVLAQAIVTNYRLPAEAVATTVEFGVGYDADLARVEAIVTQVAQQAMDAAGHDVGEREPLVRFKSFADSHVLCAAVLYVPGYGDQFPLRSDFIKRLRARFADEGIAFPYPAVTVHGARGSSLP
jgi:small-conductance mechanosensitive channel